MGIAQIAADGLNAERRNYSVVNARVTRAALRPMSRRAGAWLRSSPERRFRHGSKRSPAGGGRGLSVRDTTNGARAIA